MMLIALRVVFFSFSFFFPLTLLVLFGFIHISNLSQLQPVVEKAEKLDFIFSKTSRENHENVLPTR